MKPRAYLCPTILRFQTILETVGRTPLVGLKRIVPSGCGRILVKCEYFNPLGSVKDRIGRAMIEDAEQRGLLNEKTLIIEPTSGNTGIALAFVAASKGYPLALVMPESMSHERRALLLALGAEFVLTPAELGMHGAIAKAHELVAKESNAWMPKQFENPANPRVHELTTGPEIWRDAAGQVDVIVSAVGTGGTITGATRYLRKQNPHLVSIAVEPEESPVISGGSRGSHKIQGIGAGFIPKNLDVTLLDEVHKVSSEEAFYWARRMAREEGLLGGVSSGANIAAAIRIASRPQFRDKTIVTFACSSGERYLSTPLYELVGMPLPSRTANRTAVHI